MHQLTRQLVNNHPVIALEDLKVANMSGSAKGTSEAPGGQVSQKAGLNRRILDQAWGESARQLVYKTQAIGGKVIYVNAAYSSQECRMCGNIDKANRKTQASFLCVACGHAEHADTHAAKNILARGCVVWEKQLLAAGHAASVCGGDVRRKETARLKCAAPAKQKPTGEVARA
jgi:putative transposase